MSDTRESTLGAIRFEADEAQAKYGDFASAHEAYGVLAEEVTELFEGVRMSQLSSACPEVIRREAVQVAAVALRIAEQAARLTR